MRQRIDDCVGSKCNRNPRAGCNERCRSCLFATPAVRRRTPCRRHRGLSSNAWPTARPRLGRPENLRPHQAQHSGQRALLAVRSGIPAAACTVDRDQLEAHIGLHERRLPPTRRVIDADMLPHEVDEPALATGKSSEAKGGTTLPCCSVANLPRVHIRHNNDRSLPIERIIVGLADDKGRQSSISCANGRFRGDAGEPDVQITRRKKGVSRETPLST